MYAKFGRIHKEWELLDKMYDGNIVLWFTMIAWYTKNGFLKKKGLKTCMQNLEQCTIKLIW